jgi:hypothetical protein
LARYALLARGGTFTLLIITCGAELAVYAAKIFSVTKLANDAVQTERLARGVLMSSRHAGQTRSLAFTVLVKSLRAIEAVTRINFAAAETTDGAFCAIMHI